MKKMKLKKYMKWNIIIYLINKIVKYKFIKRYIIEIL